jgi:type VI secretion system secreted protein Hcp
MAHEDFFLKVETEKGGAVKGEAQDTDHKDEIDVIGWSWGMSAPTSATGTRKGRAAIHQLVVRKRADSSSTALMGAVARNDKIKTAVLTARRAGKGQQTYLKITLHKAYVTSFEVQGGGGDEGTGTVEQVKLAFNAENMCRQQFKGLKHRHEIPFRLDVDRRRLERVGLFSQLGWEIGGQRC